MKSSTALEQCPPARLPEFAVIGRSNVGKSSIINLLTGQKALALVSKTPGALGGRKGLKKFGRFQGFCRCFDGAAVTGDLEKRLAGGLQTLCCFHTCCIHHARVAVLPLLHRSTAAAEGASPSGCPPGPLPPVLTINTVKRH